MSKDAKIITGKKDLLNTRKDADLKKYQSIMRVITPGCQNIYVPCSVKKQVIDPNKTIKIGTWELIHTTTEIETKYVFLVDIISEYLQIAIARRNEKIAKIHAIIRPVCQRKVEISASLKPTKSRNSPGFKIEYNCFTRFYCRPRK